MKSYQRPSTLLRRKLILAMSGLLTMHLFAKGDAHPGEEEPLVRVNLLCSSNDASEAVTVALHFRIRKGWHLYWKNPGDSGLPVDVEWEIPDGFALSEIRFPVPMSKKEDEGQTYIYENEVALLCILEPLTMHPRRQEVVIRARLDWFVCKESCLRGGDEVSLALTSVSDGEVGKYREMIDEWGRRMPRRWEESGLRLRQARFSEIRGEKAVELIFSGNKGTQIRDFFPEAMDGFSIRHSAIRVDGNRITIPLIPASEFSRMKELKGLLFTTDGCYEFVGDLEELIH